MKPSEPRKADGLVPRLKNGAYRGHRLRAGKGRSPGNAGLFPGLQAQEEARQAQSPGALSQVFHANAAYMGIGMDVRQLRAQMALKSRESFMRIKISSHLKVRFWEINAGKGVKAKFEIAVVAVNRRILVFSAHPELERFAD